MLLQVVFLWWRQRWRSCGGAGGVGLTVALAMVLAAAVARLVAVAVTVVPEVAVVVTYYIL